MQRDHRRLGADSPSADARRIDVYADGCRGLGRRTARRASGGRRMTTETQPAEDGGDAGARDPDRHRQPHRARPTSCRSPTARSARSTCAQIKTDDDDFGLMAYDPAFMNTASCRSAITYIDGDKGILEYRGYPIEQLAEHSTYLEVAYLLVNGELPTQRAARRAGPTRSRSTPSCTRTSRTSCRASATTPTRWGCCSASVGALSTFYPDAKDINDPESRHIQTIRLIAKMPTLAAFAYRHMPRPAVRLPRQRPVLLGELPRDDVQDDRAEVRARPAARARARRPLHPPRRPRAELLDERGAQRRLLAGRPVLGGRRRRRRALRPAARRRQRGGAADAARASAASRTSPASSRA